MLPEFVQAVEDTCRDIMSNIHTAMPGTITAYSNGRVDVQINGKFYVGDEACDYPAITGCPVLTAGGIASPISVGDDCLLVFAEQSITEWLTGATGDSNERWSISNAIAICGLKRTESSEQAQANSSGSIVVDNLKSNGEVSIQGRDVKESLETHDTDIEEAEESIGNVQDDVADVSQDVATLQSDVTSLQNRGVYSTTETVVGTWEGATLYRKVMEIEVTTSGSTSYSLGMASSKVKFFEAFAIVGSQMHEGYYASASQYFRVMLLASSIGVSVGGDAPSVPLTVRLILYYVK